MNNSQTLTRFADMMWGEELKQTLRTYPMSRQQKLNTIAQFVSAESMDAWNDVLDDYLMLIGKATPNPTILRSESLGDTE